MNLWDKLQDIPEEDVLETVAIGDRVFAIKDFYKAGRDCLGSVLNVQNLVTKEDMTIYNKGLVYLKNFETFRKSVLSKCDSYYEHFSTCCSYYEPILGTNSEEIEQLEKKALEQEYSQEYFHKRVEDAFKGYKVALKLKPVLDFFKDIDTEEKYCDYLVDVINANVWNDRKGYYDVHLFYFDEERKSNGIFHSSDKIKRGKRAFIQRFKDGKETIEQLQIFVVYCNYPVITKDVAEFYELNCDIPVADLNKKLKDMEKKLVKLG